MKDIKCSIVVHFDAVAGWLGTYGGEDAPSDIQRGMFAGEVGTPRLLRLFEKYGLTTSWYIPGHSIETFPDRVDSIAEAGHEIGLHGYSHENPLWLSAEQEEAIMAKCISLIKTHTGTAPTGYAAPFAEMSDYTPTLLEQYGILYDQSQGLHDFIPYYVRAGDSWTKIDYSKPAEAWMKPLVRGNIADIVEIPFSWHLDDLPPLMFIKTSPNSAGWVNPRDVEQWWRDQFDWVYRELDYGVFTMMVHPDVGGRPHVLLMLERLINHINGFPGVSWMTMNDIALDFKSRYPYPGADGDPFMPGSC